MVTSAEWQLLKSVSSLQGPGKAWRNARLCVCGCLCVDAFVNLYKDSGTFHMCKSTCESAHQCPSSCRFIFQVKALVWCLSRGHTQINRGKVNQAPQSAASRPRFSSFVCLPPVFPLNPPPKTHSDTHYSNLYNPRDTEPQGRKTETSWLLQKT